MAAISSCSDGMQCKVRGTKFMDPIEALVVALKKFWRLKDFCKLEMEVDWSPLV